MTNRTLICVVVLVLALSACAQPKSRRWKSNTQPVSDTADRKAKNGFGGALIVVDDPRSFMEMWSKPDFPDFDTVKIAKRNSTIGAFIMFAGCKPGKDGKCDTVVDYSLIGPKGNTLGESLDQVIWNDIPPPVENTHVSKACLTITFTDNNLAGEYKVKAVVKDRNADVTFELENSFQLK